MKKSILLWGLSALMATTFVACDKEDDGQDSSSDLIGKWVMVVFESYDKESGEIYYRQTYNVEDEEFSFTFDKNGNLLARENNGNYYDEDGGTWSHNGEKLTLTYFDEEGEPEHRYYTVKELTRSKLVIDEYEDFTIMTFTRVE